MWKRHHCRWRTAKFRPTCMLVALGLWEGRDLYRATPAVTRGLSFSDLIRRTAPFSRLLRHTRRCGESILTRILTSTECKDIWTINLRWQIQFIWLYELKCFLFIEILNKYYQSLIYRMNFSTSLLFLFLQGWHSFAKRPRSLHPCIIHVNMVFPVSSERPPHLVASYDTRGDAEDLF
jgi:hypothetical protein